METIPLGTIAVEPIPLETIPLETIPLGTIRLGSQFGACSNSPGTQGRPVASGCPVVLTQCPEAGRAAAERLTRVVIVPAMI